MQLSNRYYKCAKISEAKFRYLLRLLALDLTASDAARLTGLSVRSVNELYLRFRRRLQQLCPVPDHLQGAVELDEFVQGASHLNGIESFGSFAKARLQPFQGFFFQKDTVGEFIFKALAGGINRSKAA